MKVPRRVKLIFAAGGKPVQRQRRWKLARRWIMRAAASLAGAARDAVVQMEHRRR